MTETSPLSLLVCDDHPIVLEGLAVIINQVSDFKLLETCSGGEQLLQAVELFSPDIILVDANLKDENGYGLVAKIRNQLLLSTYQPTLIIITSYWDDFSAEKAKLHGAHGFLPKSISARDLIQRIKEIHHSNKENPHSTTISQFPFPHISGTSQTLGEKKNSGSGSKENLTKRELAIIQELITGKPTKTLADILCISPYTLETHKKNIFRKLKVNSVGELIAWFHNQSNNTESTS